MVRSLLTTGAAFLLLGGLVWASALVAPQAQPSTVGQRTQAPEAAPSPQALELFRRQIRPLLAGKCLKCHNADRREGGLDLSRRSAALAGGDSGEAMAPGRPQESLLYQLVTAGEMPPEMNPLSAAETAALEQWIAWGAPYDEEPLSPANEEPRPTDGVMCPCMKMMMNGVTGGKTLLPLSKPMTRDEVRERAEHYLASQGNPHLKIGRVIPSAVSYEVEVVTNEDSLVNWIIVERKTGRLRFLY
ncbi:MAG: hypothetical protein KY475_09690 [Planctomycetes bacterium]|nr:hypothetical protein [Planctomycetota bacterium]